MILGSCAHEAKGYSAINELHHRHTQSQVRLELTIHDHMNLEFPCEARDSLDSLNHVQPHQQMPLLQNLKALKLLLLVVQVLLETLSQQSQYHLSYH